MYLMNACIPLLICDACDALCFAAATMCVKKWSWNSAVFWCFLNRKSHSFLPGYIFFTYHITLVDTDLLNTDWAYMATVGSDSVFIVFLAGCLVRYALNFASNSISLVDGCNISLSLKFKLTSSSHSSWRASCKAASLCAQNSFLFFWKLLWVSWESYAWARTGSLVE